ncbi:substrate-binding domain-containing protein [Tissierella sp. Yu-01]|uniref:substrate-binding domain-containing protein n=1 Tax=Tissierella sp. Yu-01 TaxID=3035694 RepID=UPI00240DD15F|nr:substrate-binding domain-containing protein [Tissierella sp. Yu-01]WFA08346.1 substrate-binding domain-containing protein [Tissierella sp. Yu-01]
MKKILSLVLVAIMISLFTIGCTQSETPEAPAETPSETPAENNFDTSRTINVVSREDGSGTRGAFVEIVGILEKDADGNEVDRTYEEAIIQNGTDAVMTTVAGDEYAIGYISLGSLNDTVKAVTVEGAEATSENVQNGSYKIARPFNIAYKGDLNPLAQDFMDFILSAEGQAIVVEEGYVQVGTDLPAYEGSSQEGELVVAGSTSVTPVMEKLVEAYQGIHSGVSIEIQSTGSSAGMQSAIEGTADLGMASRDLKDSELEVLTNEVIAIDGIAVIVNKNNTVNDLTIDNIKAAFVGESTEWSTVED